MSACAPSAMEAMPLRARMAPSEISKRGMVRAAVYRNKGVQGKVCSGAMQGAVFRKALPRLISYVHSVAILRLWAQSAAR